MTLRDFLTSYGFLSNPSAAKARCPFHADNTPSAMIHDDDNTLWCYACRRLYTPVDFRIKFNVQIDEVRQQELKAPELVYPWGEVLFYA